MEKIDKRTNAYKDSIKYQEIVNEYERNKRIDNVIIEAAAKGLPVDFSKSADNPGFQLCGKCGEDNLEHNDDGSLRTRRQPEACRDCTWADADKIVCEDGVLRDKGACKRMTRMVGADEVFYWVKK